MKQNYTCFLSILERSIFGGLRKKMPKFHKNFPSFFSLPNDTKFSFIFYFLSLLFYLPYSAILPPTKRSFSVFLFCFFFLLFSLISFLLKVLLQSGEEVVSVGGLFIPREFQGRLTMEFTNKAFHTLDWL